MNIKSELNPVERRESNQVKPGEKNQVRHGGQSGNADFDDVAGVRYMTAQWAGY